MDLPLQITWRGIAHSEALDAAIRDKAAKLQQFYERIIRCKVVVELAGRRKQQGKHFVVRVELKLPGGDMAVNRDHDEDIHVALRDAFDAARRKLQDFNREHAA
jgi:ribosomal subunit interface protein